VVVGMFAPGRGGYTVGWRCSEDPLRARDGKKSTVAIKSNTITKIGRPITRSIINQPNPNIIIGYLLFDISIIEIKASACKRILAHSAIGHLADWNKKT
jgi:hypothetical protein